MVRFLEKVAVPVGLCATHSGYIGSHFFPGDCRCAGERSDGSLAAPSGRPRLLGESLSGDMPALSPLAEGANRESTLPDAEQQKRANLMVNVAMCCRESQLF